MIHNITIKGKPCKIEYSTILTLEDAQLARSTGNGIPSTGKITITESENFYTVYEFLVSASDVNIADLRVFYKRFQILPDDGVKDLGSKEIGVSVEEFVGFMNNTFPESNVYLIVATAVNRILTAEIGYECRAFTQSDLSPMQPLLFDLVAAGKTITANVTDSTGACTYSLDGINYQESNIFENLADGNYTIFVKDSTSYINKKEISISELI